MRPTALYQEAILTLTRLLHRYHGKRVIVLVDEYDLPINEAYHYGYYDAALPFLTSTFTNALKDNTYLEKGLLTGVLRVAKLGYLSSLNNLRVYSLLDRRNADIYGVQQQEWKDAGLIDKIDDVKRYYNGYSTAIPSNLYNPWSILNYLYEKELKPFWIETGKTDFITNAIWSSPVSAQQNILPLLNGETLLVPFDLTSSVDVLWSLLYFSGYLTGEKVNARNLNVHIPNTEVNQELSVI